jgi:hypothetical protein
MNGGLDPRVSEMNGEPPFPSASKGFSPTRTVEGRGRH